MTFWNLFENFSEDRKQPLYHKAFKFSLIHKPFLITGTSIFIPKIHWNSQNFLFSTSRLGSNNKLKRRSDSINNFLIRNWDGFLEHEGKDHLLFFIDSLHCFQVQKDYSVRWIGCGPTFNLVFGIAGSRMKQSQHCDDSVPSTGRQSFLPISFPRAIYSAKK